MYRRRSMKRDGEMERWRERFIVNLQLYADHLLLLPSPRYMYLYLEFTAVVGRNEYTISRSFFFLPFNPFLVWPSINCGANVVESENKRLLTTWRYARPFDVTTKSLLVIGLSRLARHRLDCYYFFCSIYLRKYRENLLPLRTSTD